MSGEPQLPIFQFWDSEPAPAEVAELLASVRELNPASPHLLFDRERAEQFIAEHLTRREVAAFRACAVPAMQADYFRYCAVLVRGGIYVDADFRCVGPLRPLLGEAEQAKLFERVGLRRARLWVQPYPTVMNSVFAFRSPGHPLLRLALDVATANVERRQAENVWAATGPGIFTSLRLLADLGSAAAFRERAGGDWLAPTAGTVCEVVGDPARAAAAFAGVGIGPEAEARARLAVASRLPYKFTEAHWHRWRTSIYLPAA